MTKWKGQEERWLYQGRCRLRRGHRLLHYSSGDEPELFQLFSRIILLSSISDYVTFYIAYIIYYEYNVY